MGFCPLPTYGRGRLTYERGTLMNEEYKLTLIASGLYRENNANSVRSYDVEVSTYQLNASAVSAFTVGADYGTPEMCQAAENEREVLAEEQVLAYLSLPFPGNNDGVIVTLIHSQNIPDILVVVVKRPQLQEDGSDRLLGGCAGGI